MKVLDRTKQQILDAGFSHIKLELEAQLGRDDDYSETCYHCEGAGSENCEDCDGDGAIDTGDRVGRFDQAVYEECSSCDGDGRMTCSSCDGEGESEHGGQDNDYCQDFMLEHISREARQALTYGEFYNDGSVDSEYTFTLPVSASEYFPEYIRAFVALADHIGNGLDVDGAGMHITVIPTEANGRYPSRAQISGDAEHFAREVTKLLPALYFSATSNSISRGLDYRYPRVSSDNKYSAIYTHGNTCLEYRLFDTCYDKPEAIFEFLEVISNTLRYLNPANVVPAANKNFLFEFYGHELARFYRTPDQLRVLQSTLKYVKPEGKTIKQMKEERGIKHNVTTLSVNYKRRLTELRAEYAQLMQRHHSRKTQVLTGSNDRLLEQVRETVRWQGITEDEAINQVCGVIPSFTDFARDNLYRNGQLVTV